MALTKKGSILMMTTRKVKPILRRTFDGAYPGLQVTRSPPTMTVGATKAKSKAFIFSHW